MKVRLRLPETGLVDLAPLLESMTGAPAAGLAPFADEAVEFCAGFSRALMRSAEAQRFPELRALGFWMRRTELVRLGREFAALAGERTVMVPRGVVFHLPPANVDTLFVYSWLLSFLVGNRNIVRLSSRTSVQSEAICSLLERLTAGASEAVRRNTLVLTYGHEQEITAAISAVADVRVIWGGDATVAAVRAVPLPPHAKDLAFPDRFSFAVIAVQPFLALGHQAQVELVERFFNDAYWFDQMGCASPRLVVWCGPEAECVEASLVFFSLLRDVVAARGYALETGGVLGKLTFVHRAVLDRPVSGYAAYGNEVTVLSLGSLAGARGEHCGGGLYFQYRVGRLADVAEFAERRDQTLTHFGFRADELRDFVRALNGKGIDRLVPVGQALTFNRFWDGYDLLQELTRRVYVEVESAAAVSA